MLVYVFAAALLVLYTLGSFYPEVAGRVLADRLQHQFGPFRHLEARVETDPPIDAVAGDIDALHVQAEGFAVQGLPIEKAAIDTGPFRVSVGSLWLGRAPALAKPISATVSALVTEDGLNAFLHSPAMVKLLRGIPAQISLLPGIVVTQNLDVNPGRLRLLTGELTVDGTLSLGGAEVPFAATASPRVIGGTTLVLEGIEATMLGSPVPPSLLSKASQAFDLARYQEPGSSFSIASLVVQPGTLRLTAAVEVTTLKGR